MTEPYKISLAVSLLLIVFSGLLSGLLVFFMSRQSGLRIKPRLQSCVLYGIVVAALMIFALQYLLEQLFNNPSERALNIIFFGGVSFMAGVFFLILRSLWLNRTDGKA